MPERVAQFFYLLRFEAHTSWISTNGRFALMYLNRIQGRAPSSKPKAIVINRGWTG
jgi:hypothetical protein